MIQQMIDHALNLTDYKNNPYFLALKANKFEKSDFLETQIQFYFAVTFFSRPMAVVGAKIPCPLTRLEVIRNVWEEHGEGNLHNIHAQTFTTLLKRLGLEDIQQINQRTLWPCTRQFNTVLVGGALDEYLIGVGMLGIIEHMFSEISSWIGQGILSNGWLTKENMIHYSLHEELDVKHAQDFFDVFDSVVKKGDIDDLYMIEQGIMMGAHAFNNFYENLYASRKQRLFRKATCPHART